MNNLPHPLTFSVLIPSKQQMVINIINDKFSLEKELTNDVLFTAINDVLGISKELMQSKTRLQEVVTARQIFIGIQRDYGNFITLVETGKLLGNRDHPTIIYSYDIYKDMIFTRNKKFIEKLNAVKNYLSKFL